MQVLELQRVRYLVYDMLRDEIYHTRSLPIHCDQRTVSQSSDKTKSDTPRAYRMDAHARQLEAEQPQTISDANTGGSTLRICQVEQDDSWHTSTVVDPLVLAE